MRFYISITLSALLASTTVALNAAPGATEENIINDGPAVVLARKMLIRRPTQGDRFDLARRTQDAGDLWTTDNESCSDSQEEVEFEFFSQFDLFDVAAFSTCPITCLDPADDPSNPTLPPVDAICTIGDGTPEYETLLAEVEAFCESLDARILYFDVTLDGDCDVPLSKIVKVPQCISDTCTKKQAVAYLNESIIVDPVGCDVVIKASKKKKKFPKAPKGCIMPKVPKTKAEKKAKKAATAMLKKATKSGDSRK